MNALPSADRQRTFEIAIVGNDTLLAALPARPLQLAHAIHACGYDLVVPASWGEELVAMRALEILERDPGRPRVFCACPKVYSRLMSSGSELAPSLLHLIAPPAAAARYLRAIEPDTRMRITFIGSCPGAADTSIDARVSPADFMAHLERQNISVARQPLVFESVIPPDRRRYASLPGGVPSPDLLAARGVQLSVILKDQDLAAEIADHLLSAEAELVDLAQAVGCSCAAGDGGTRESITALEPPRSSLPILDLPVEISLEPAIRELPAPSQTPAPQTTRSEPPVRHETAARTEVRSIEAAARRRAERGRIAITPAGVRVNHNVRAAHVTVTPREVRREEGREGREARGGQAPQSAMPDTGKPEPEPAHTSEVLANVDSPSELQAETTPQPDPLVPTLLSPPNGPLPEETVEQPSMKDELPDAVESVVLPVVQPAAEEPSPVPAGATTTRRRTPVFGVLHASRGAAHQRKGPRKLIFPRTHGAARVADDKDPAQLPVASPNAEQEVDRPIALEPAITPVLAEPRARAFQPETQLPPRRVSRRVTPQGTSKAGRLWGLLMSILLIVAITIALLFILEG